MATHTPGPWIWADEYRGLYGAGPDNEVLEYAHYEGMWVADYKKFGKANAALIAAAPDLLEALIKLRDACIGMVPECARQVDEAISKAEGKL